MPRLAAALLLLLLVGLYGFTTRVADGRRLDDATIRYYTFEHDRDRYRAQDVADAAGAPIVAPAALALVALALWRRGRRAAIVIAALLAGAIVSARVLKAVLQAVDPFGSEALRYFGPGYFPSGHAAAITAVVLALVLLAAPGRSRAAIALAGGAIAAFIAVAHVLGLTHHPSDVVGGTLLAGVWALVLDGLLDHGDLPPRPRRRLREGLPVLIAAGVVAVTWAAVAARHHMPSMPAVGTAGPAVATLAVVGIVAALTPGSPRTARARRPPIG